VLNAAVKTFITNQDIVYLASKLVFTSERILKRTPSKIRSNLQQSIIEISSHIKSIIAIINLEYEPTASKKTFYFFSFLLLISMIFLSPDKIPLIFAPMQADIGISEKAKELIEKLVLAR
jgi:hypothetical protein